MARIRAKDTKPELRVRRLIHSIGFRYRLHRTDLPGKPDLVFGPHRKVIFVHGCFWHRHSRCKKARMPKSPESKDFWWEKLTSNAKRDRRHQRVLRKMGWEVLVVWECETEDHGQLRKIVTDFLGSRTKIKVPKTP